MENERLNLRQQLIQLRKEIIETRRILAECKKGFITIRDTGNTKVADVFLEELENLWG